MAVAALAAEGAGLEWRLDDAEFEAKIVEAVEHLKTHGFAVVEDVLPVGTCEDIVSDMWEWMEQTTQGRVKQSDPMSWAPREWVSSTHGIIQHYGIGSSKAAKKVRTAKRVLRVYEAIYGTKRLVSSMDGVAMLPAPEKRRRAIGKARGNGAAAVRNTQWPKTGQWLHTDQNPLAKGRYCIQALVSLRATDRYSSTLCVVRGSHLKHDDLVSEHGVEVMDRKHWYKFSGEEIQRIYGKPSDDAWERVTGPAGSLFLWDSRTVHQNSGPALGRPEASVMDRYVVYACFGPEAWMRPGDRKRKAAAAAAGRTTSHWPWTSTLFAVKPQTWGREGIPETTTQPQARLDPASEALWRKLTCQDPWDRESIAHETLPALQMNPYPVIMPPAIKRTASAASAQRPVKMSKAEADPATIALEPVIV